MAGASQQAGRFLCPARRASISRSGCGAVLPRDALPRPPPGPAPPRTARRYLRGGGGSCPRARGAGRDGPEVSPQGGGLEAPMGAGSSDGDASAPRLRAPARLLFTATPLIPAPGAGRGNAIKRLSLEEIGGGGGQRHDRRPTQRRAGCAAARAAPAALPAASKAGKGREGAQRGIKCRQSPRRGEEGHRVVPRSVPDGDQAPIPLTSRGLTSIHF